MIKNYLFFTRRYLGNRKSYRNKSKSVSKSKVPRFQRSLIHPPEVIIFGVIAIWIFPNFNTIRWNSKGKLWDRCLFLENNYALELPYNRPTIVVQVPIQSRWRNITFICIRVMNDIKGRYSCINCTTYSKAQDWRNEKFCVDARDAITNHV